MEGKTVIANFFFTHCPSICVQLTKNMKRLQEDIKNSNRVGSREPNFLQFISFSVDSERDSVPQLKKWADRFQINSSNWWLLTGNREDIYDLSINHMKVGLVDGKGIDTAFLHTDYMVLIDKNRHIRGYYHGLDTAALKQLARDVIFLTLEKDPKRKGLFAGKAGLLTSVFVITLIGIVLMFYLLRKRTS
jgi:protein SCO1/2